MASLGATLSTMRQENNARLARVEAGIEGNTNALEAMQTGIDARIDVLENSKSSSSSGSRKGNEQNSVRAVASGFTDSSTEEEVRDFLQGVIKNMRWKKALKTHVVQPNRHGLLQFKTEKDRNGFLRLTSRQQHSIEQRTIRFKPGMKPEERCLQNNRGLRNTASTSSAKYR